MATFYWVGGSGTWDLTTETNWSETSGGPGGQGVPTQFDDVVFDKNSDVGSPFTVAIATSSTTNATVATCRDITISGLDQVMSLGGTAAVSNYLAIYGSLYFPPTNLTITTNVQPYFLGESEHTITCNGNSLPGNQIFAGAGDYYFNGAYITSGVIDHQAGGIYTVGYNLTAFKYQNQGASSKFLQLYSSQVTLTGTATSVISMGGTNYVLDSGTSTITCSGVNPTFDGGSLTYYNVAFTNTSPSTTAINGSNIFNNLSIVSPTAAVGVRYFGLGGNVTVNGTLTLGTATNAPTSRILVYSTVFGTARTITATSTSALYDVDFRDITMTNPVSGTRLGNALGNTGITFAAGKNVYWNLAAGGNWSDNAWALSAGGAVSTANFPLCQDTVNIVDTGLNASATITLNQGWWLGSLVASSRTLAATIATGTFTSVLHGNIALSTAIVLSGTGNIDFENRSPATITSAGRTFTQTLRIYAVGSTVSLADAFIANAVVTVGIGTFNLNNQNFTAPGINSATTTYTRGITFGTGTITLNGAAPINVATTNLTLNVTGSTLICSASTVAATFTGGGATYNNVTFSATNSQTVVIAGANTFNNLTFARTTVSGLRYISIGGNTTVNGTLDFGAAINAACRHYVYSATTFTRYTITAAAVANMADVDFTSINAAGTSAPWSGTRLGDGADNTNITFPAGKTVYWNLAAGGNWNSTAWAPSAGGTVDVNLFPLRQDTAVFVDTGLTAGGGVALGSWGMPSIVATSRTLSMTLNQSTADPYLHGDVNLSSAVLWTSATSPNVTFLSVNKTHILNVPNVGGFPTNVYIYASGGTVRLTTPLNTSTSYSTVLVYGTLDLNNNTLNTRAFASNYSSTRTLAFGTTGRINLTYPTSGVSATVMDVRTTTGLTVTGTDPIIDVNAALTGTAVRTVQWSTSGTAYPFPGTLKVSAGSDYVVIQGRHKNVDFTGFSGYGNLNFTLTGNLTLNATMNTYGGGTLTVDGGVTHVLSLFGKTLNNNVTIGGSSSATSVTLAGNLILGTPYTLTLSTGTLNAGTYNMSTGFFNSSGTGTRTLNMGSGTWSLTNTGTVWDLGTTTNLTFNAQTSTIDLAYNTFNRTSTVLTFNGGSKTYNNLTFSGTVDRLRTVISGINTFNNVTSAVCSTGNKSLLFYDNNTITGTLTISGGSQIYRMALLSSKIDSVSGQFVPITLTVNAVAPMSYIDFRGITAAGASAPWSGTNLGNGAANTNITFDAPKTVYWNKTAGDNWGSNSWAATSGGAVSLANYPLAQDTAIFDDTGTTTGTVIEIDKYWYSFGTIDFSRVSKSVTLYTGNVVQTDCYGSFVFSPSIKVTGSGRWYPVNTGSITSNGVQLPIQFYFNLYNNGTFTLNDDLVTTYPYGAETLNVGTLDLNEYTFRCQYFGSSSATNLRSIDFGSTGRSKIIVDGNNGTVFSTSSPNYLTVTGNPIVESTYMGRTGIRTFTAGGGTNSIFRFKVIGGADFISTGGTTHCLGWDFGTFSGTFLNVSRYFYGDIILSPYMTLQAGANTQIIAGSNTKLTTQGKLLDFPVTIGTATNDNVQLQGALLIGSTRTLTHSYGTFDLNNYTVTTGIFNTNNSNTRAIDFDTGKIVVTANSTTVFNASNTTNLTLYGTPSVEVISSGTSGTRSIDVGNNGGTVSPSLAIDFKFVGQDFISVFGGATAVYGTLDFTGFSGTFATASTNRVIYGDLLLSSAMTLATGTGILYFNKPSGTAYIRSNGKTLSYPINISTGGTIQLVGALNIGTDNTLTLTSGTLDTNGYNITAGSFVSNSSLDRSLVLGTSTVTLSGTTTAWSITDTENIMTVSADQSTINLINNTTSSTVFRGGVKQYNIVTFTGTVESGVNQIADSNTFKVINVYGPATQGRRVLYVRDNQTITQKLNILDTANLRRLHFISTNRPNGASTLNIAATSSLSDIEFKDIWVTGNAAPLTGTRFSDCGDNQGIIFDTPKTVYWNKPAGGNITDNAWALTSGGTTDLLNSPLAQDTVIFDNAGLNNGSTITVDIFCQFGSMVFTNLTNSVTFTTTNKSIGLQKDLLLSPAVTISNSLGIEFSGSGITQNLRINGANANSPFGAYIVNNGTLKLMDDVGPITSFTLVAGNLDLNNKNLTTAVFLTNYSNTRTIDFKETSILYLTGNNTTIWACNTAANFTIFGTNKVIANYSGSTGTRTFAHSNIDATGTDNNVINLYVTAGGDTLATSGFFGTIGLTGFSGTLGTNNRTIFGDLILSPTMTTTAATSTTVFVGNGNTQRIYSNGINYPYNVTINKLSGEVILQDALNITASKNITLLNGTFTANNYNVTMGSFVCDSSNLNSPVLNMGTGTWSILGYTFDARCVGLTINASTSTIDMGSATAKAFAAQSGGTFHNVRNTGAGELVFSRSANYNNLYTTVTPATIKFSGGYSYFKNFSIANEGNITLASATPGTKYTLVNRSSGEFNLSNFTISDANATPAEWWVAQTTNGNTDAGNNTGIVFTGAPRRAQMLAMF